MVILDRSPQVNPSARPFHSKILSSAEYAQNLLQHLSTNLTLFQCFLGYQPSLYPWNAAPTKVPFCGEMVQEE